MHCKFLIVLTSMVMSLGCSFPSLERSIFEYLSLFQFVENRQNYSISLEVSGLLGTGLVVQNANDTLNISANGRFEFPSRLPRGREYNVRITTQPTAPIQECQVFGGTGQVQSANVSTIQVVCGDELVVVSGNVTGLVGSGLELTNTTGTGTFPISVGSTSFAFPAQAKNSTYNLSVTNQPTNPWQTCSITNPAVLSGTIPDTGLVIEVNCITDQYPLSVQVVGIGIVGTLTPGNELQVQVNGSETINFSGDTTISFPTTLLSGTAYSLAILNPGGVVTTGPCSIPSPNGNIAGMSNVVVVNCSTGYLATGTVSILGGTPSSIVGSGLVVSLTNTGGTAFTTQNLNVNAGDTTFSFSTPIPIGAQFQVSITTQPTSPTQLCGVTGTGAIPVLVSGNVNDLVVTCNLPDPVVITATGNFTDTFNVSFIPPDVTGAEFRYTLGDGTAGQPDPDCGVTPDISTGLVPIASNTAAYIKIRQCRAGWTPSGVVTAGPFNLRVADPTPSIPSLTALNEATPVNFTTATTGATWFCHTTDIFPTVPADPVCGGTVNTCTTGTNLGFSMPPINSRNVKVVGCRENFQGSNVVNLEYPIATYQISGTIAGLTTPFGAGSFVLQNNGGDNLTISANGSFTFATPVASGANYNVTVFSQPQNPWQTCAITNATGSVTNANIANVNLNCTINQYNLSGTISGPNAGNILAGTSITIDPGAAVGTPFTLNSGDPMPTFLVNSGVGLDYTITAQPQGQHCVFVNPTTISGTVAGANINTLDINCVDGYLVGNQFQTLPPNRLDIHLYQGKVGDGPGSHTTPGALDGPMGTSRFNSPRGVVNVKGNLYLVDSGNHAIRRVQLSDASTITFVGGLGVSGDLDAFGTAARITSPWDLTTDGTFLYLTDSGNHKIKKIRISTGQVTTLAGTGTGGFSDGVGTSASFNTPQGIAYHANNLYIADTGNRRIRRLNLLTGDVVTIAGDGTIGGNDGIGTGARMDNATSLVYLNGFLYIADSGLHTIRRFNLADNSLTTVVGQSGFIGHRDATGSQARLWGPNGLMTDGFDLYFTQSSIIESKRIRRVELPSFRVTTIAGQEQASTNASEVGVRARFDTPSNLTTEGKQIFITDFHRGRGLSNNELRFYYPLDGGNLFPYGLEDAGNLTGFGTPEPGFTSADRFGVANRSVLLNGTDQYLAALDNNFPISTTSRSLCAWAKPTTLPPLGIARVVAGYGSNTVGGGFSIGIRGENSSTSVFVSGVSDNVLAYMTLEANRWIHICGLYDGVTASVYANGKLIGRQPKTWDTTLAGANGFQIGARGGVNLFTGSVADVRIYSRILSEGEILDLAKYAEPSEVGPSYAVHPSGLVLHYKLDGPLGTEKFKNYGVSTYDLTTQQGLPLSSRGTDLRGNGSLFTRTGGRRLPGADDIHALPFWDAPRTLCSWVKPEFLPKNNGDISTIMEYGQYIDGRLFSLVLAKQGTFDTLGVNVRGTLFTRNSTLPLHTWSHVCASFDTSAFIRIYVNGTQIGTEIPTTIVNTSSIGQIRLGFTEDPGLNYFPGSIDDVRLYNHALSVDEIRLLATPIQAGLIARYDFRGDTQDRSGFGNNLTGNNISSIPNRWKEPVSAYRFNGTNSRISNTNEISKVTDQISFSAWIRPSIVPTANSLIFYNGNSASNGYGLYLLNGSNHLFFLDGGVGGSNTNVQIPIHIWTHVGFIKNGLNIKIFINGRQVFDDTNLATIEPNGPLSIGSNPSNTEHFNGDISDVTLFNRALLPEEMVALSGYHPWQTSAWNPDPVTSSMIGHYQAESFDFLTNGNPITAWIDNSGKGHNLTTLSASPPTYTTGTFPHRPSVRFVETANQFAQMDTGFPLDATNFTFFSVQKFDPLISILDSFILNYGSGFNPLQISSHRIAPNFGLILCRSNDFCGTPNAITEMFPLETIFMGSFRKSANDVFSFSNGKPDTNTTIPGAFDTNGLLRIGARVTNERYFRGDLGEILIFNNQLTGNIALFGINERDYIDCYLSAKYGIPFGPASTISCP